MSKSATNEEYIEIAKTNEIANIDGKVYALNDRCGHMNALLSMGTLQMIITL